MTGIMQKRALITGLNGFTGRYLAHELGLAGYRVFGTAHVNEQVEQDMVAVDLCNREELRRVVAEVRPDVVAHLAAISFVAHGDVEAIYRTNVVGTRNLLEALAGLEKRPSAVLLASSANIYGNAAVEIIDELVPPSPSNDYAVSKLAMEFLARLYFDRLPIILARPFNYTGVGQARNFLLPKIVDHFCRHASVIELGNLDVARDFSDVRMVAKVYRRLLETPEALGGVFNVCSGRAYSLRDVLAMAASLSGHSLEVKVNPAFVRANDVRVLRGSRAKLESVIGPVDDIGLEETLRWMLGAAA
jgi:nucleoside-diphosphate-sugar epimerase